MAIAAGTNIENTFEQLIGSERWQPPVIAVPEIAADRETRLRAAQLIGSVALESTAAAAREQAAPPAYTLLDAVRQAAEGDTEAYAMVRNNVATDVIERTIKSGHITKVRLETDADGHIMQHGQTAIDIQKNSLRYAADSPFMRRRTEAETRNMFRIDEAHRQGLLADYAFVVFSPAPDDTTTAEMAEAGFFTDTLSCAIQVTTAEADGLSVESAFVAGKAAWDAPRHDLTTLGEMGESLGVALADKSTAEILDTPLLVHKSLLPHGVVDLVKLYDASAGGTFFGEAKPRQDYLAYKQACKEREASFQPRVDTITRQLIAEAATLQSPQAASRRLGKLSGAQMVEQSIVDTSIDPRVFGEAAAWRIEHARHLMAIGQVDGLQAVINQAKTLERSGSCPSGMKGGDALTGIDGISAGDSDNQSGSANKKLEDCEFVSKECPKCHKKDVKTVVKKGVYYGDCGCHS